MDTVRAWQRHCTPAVPWKRLRRLATLNPSKSEVAHLTGHQEVSFLPMEAVSETGKLDLSHKRPVEEVRTGYTYFADNDVVVAKITPCFENGKGALVSGLTNGVGFGTTEFHVIRSGKDLDPVFLYYLTASDAFRKVGGTEMYGAAGQRRVSDDFIADFPVATLPLETQCRIAAFLDRKTAAIDALIAKKQRLITLLQEKRQALITHAVTKGLNPKAPMKDSGIPWIGEIPAHWECQPLRRSIKRLFQGWSPLADSRPAEDGEIGVLKISAIKKGCFVASENKTSDVNPLEALPYMVKQGQLLVTRGNTPDLVADCCVVPPEVRGLFASDLIYLVEFGCHIDPSFIAYFLLSRKGRDQIQLDARGSSMSMCKVSQSHIRSWLCPRPSLNEQREIISYLQDKLAETDVAIARLSNSVDKLTEYRQSLISAAVTGQLPIPENDA